MPKLLSSRWLWAGVALLLVGSGPLVIAVLYSKAHGDLHPNPIGLGICAMFTFWPSLGMILAGLVAGYRRRRSARSEGKKR